MGITGLGDLKLPVTIKYKEGRTSIGLTNNVEGTLVMDKNTKLGDKLNGEPFVLGLGPNGVLSLDPVKEGPFGLNINNFNVKAGNEKSPIALELAGMSVDYKLGEVVLAGEVVNSRYIDEGATYSVDGEVIYATNGKGDVLMFPYGANAKVTELDKETGKVATTDAKLKGTYSNIGKNIDNIISAAKALRVKDLERASQILADAGKDSKMNVVVELIKNGKPTHVYIDIENGESKIRATLGDIPKERHERYKVEGVGVKTGPIETFGRVMRLVGPGLVKTAKASE